MESIQNKAMTKYQDNMMFFSQKYPELFKKLTLFDMAIQNGQYKERYQLEYKQDGYFDVLDTVSNEWLYGTSSIEQAKKIAKSITFSKEKGVIETFYNYSFDDKAIEYALSKDPTISRFVLVAPVVGYIQRVITKKNPISKIYKFIFFGVGLGLHIEEIYKKFHPYITLIVEDNLELFRLSLFVTDYKKLSDNSDIYFAIMANDAELKSEFNKMYHNSFIHNNYIKYDLFYDNYREKIAKIQNYIVTQSSQTYLQDMLLKKNIRVLDSITKEFKFINIGKNYEDNTIFSQRPVVLVAAGPSLDKNIEWLKKNAPFVTIVALFMTSVTLSKHGIYPDVVVHIDENRPPVEKTMVRIVDKEKFFENSLFLLSPSVEMDLFLELTKKERIYLFEDRTRYRFKFGHLESFSVGETAYALSLIFGIKELYLLGLDLALDPETRKTHTDEHESSKSDLKIEKSASTDYVTLRGSEFLVKGNFLDKVPTTPLFDMSIHRMNYFTKTLKKEHQNVYNLNNGAYFDEAVPTKPEEVDFLNLSKKAGITDKIKDFFDANSSNVPDKEEAAAMDDREEDVAKKIEDIETFSANRYPSMEQFHEAFVQISGKMITPSSKNSPELSGIYYVYLENIGGYIGDFFNSKGVENPKKHIKKLQKIISAQFLKIAKKYKEALDKFYQANA